MMKVMKTIFHYGGLVTYDPETSFQKYFYNFLQIIPLASATVFSFLSIMDLVMNVRTLPELAENCNLSITGCLVYLKAIHITLNVDLMKSILKEFEDMQLNKFHASLLNTMIYVRIAMTQASSCFILWNTVIVRKVPPFRVWLPFDMYSNYGIYWITMIFLVVVFVVMSLILFIVGSLITITMIFLCEHIVEVQKKFRSIEWSPGESDDKLMTQLKECVTYHQRLYEYVNKIYICNLQIVQIYTMNFNFNFQFGR